MRSIHRRSIRPLGIKAVNAKTRIAAFAAGVEQQCRRMNPGLAAVAAVLGLVLLAVIALRGAEFIADATVAGAMDGVPAAGWGY